MRRNHSGAWMNKYRSLTVFPLRTCLSGRQVPRRRGFHLNPDPDSYRDYRDSAMCFYDIISLR